VATKSRFAKRLAHLATGAAGWAGVAGAVTGAGV
jgi:hypothetical protein